MSTDNLAELAATTSDDLDAGRITIGDAYRRLATGIAACQPPPPAATSDKDEREHCERVLRDLQYETLIDDAKFIQLLLTERAAAYAEGFEAGRKHNDK